MPSKPNNLARFFIRLSAFLLKEMLEIARQPLLLVTLVLGPFLILLFFGIGFRNEPQALRTLFVVSDENSTVAQEVEQYGTTLGKQLIYQGITTSKADALLRLERGEVDLVVTVPEAPFARIRHNQQAVFGLYHRELNPIQAGYVGTFGRVYVDEVNRRVLQYITQVGQLDAGKIEVALTTVRDNIQQLQQALENCAQAVSEAGSGDDCDTTTVEQLTNDLDRSVDEMHLELGDKASVSDSAQRWLQGDTGGNVHKDLQPALNRLVRNTNKITDIQTAQQQADDYLERAKNLTQLEGDLSIIQTRLDEFAGIDPWVLVSPFRSEITSVAAISPNVTDYYAPAVIVMLLQHLTVTFAALSLVRERQLGSIELFTVAPISALETLLGKYLSYLIFGSALAAILLGLLILGMQVPIIGSWGGVAVTILALVFTSLGIGFVISLISSTDTQAVQYAMLVLLTSVFFSGFILELNTLWEPVRAVSWLLPVTYGIVSLRDIMLRGYPLDWALMAQLAGLGLLLFGLSWWLLRRSMTQL